MNLLHSGLCKIILAANTSGSLADKLPQTVVNILLGFGILFVVLIFIFGLVYLVKLIPNLLNSSDKPVGNIPNTVTHTDSPVNINKETIIEEELTNDLELVAVITAAIMASMGNEAPADGLVVRSIRKINNKRWQNA